MNKKTSQNSIERLGNKNILFIEPTTSAFQNISSTLLGTDAQDRKISIVRAENYGVALEKMIEAKRRVMEISNRESLPVRERDFDIVFSEYDLTGGKTAPDLLSTIREEKLIRLGTIFIMIAAERSQARVMSVLEYAPDSYVIKPIKPDDLEKRMLKAIFNRKELYHIYFAVDKKDFRKALALCNEYIQSGRRLVRRVLKIKADICIELKEYEEARLAYEQINIMERHEAASKWRKPEMVAYADEGIAKTMYYLGEHDEAEKTLQSIILANSDYMQAYDTLADVLIGVGKENEALKVYSDAVKRSPNQFKRQKDLGTLALDLGELDVAESAFKALTGEWKFSNAATPDVYAHRAEIQLEKWEDLDSILRGLEAATAVYKKTDKENMAAANFCIATMQAEVYEKKGDKVRAQASMAKAINLYDQGVTEWNILGERMQQRFAAQCVVAENASDKQKAIGERLLEKVIQNSGGGDRVKNRAEKMFKDPGRKSRFFAMHEKVTVNFDKYLKEISSQFLSHPKMALDAIKSLVADSPENPEVLALATQLYLRNLERHLFRELLVEENAEARNRIKSEIREQFENVQQWYASLLKNHPKLAKKYFLETLYVAIKKKHDDSGISESIPKVSVSKQADSISITIPDIAPLSPEMENLLDGIKL